MSEAVETAKSMTAEFIEEDGFVSCEFALTQTALDNCRDTFAELNESLRAECGAQWIVYECATCQGYHGEDYKWHAEIRRAEEADFDSEEVQTF